MLEGQTLDLGKGNEIALPLDRHPYQLGPVRQGAYAHGLAVATRLVKILSFGN